jgi:hypothetical protein
MDTMNRKHQIPMYRITMRNPIKKGKAPTSQKDPKTRTHQNPKNQATTRNPEKTGKAQRSLKGPKNQTDETTQRKHAKENNTRLNISQDLNFTPQRACSTVGIPFERRGSGGLLVLTS